MSPDPAYQRVAQTIRARIEDGTYEPGGRLPSLTEMEDEFSVSHTTSRRIYAMLVNQGIVVAKHGAGYFVPERKPVERVASERLKRAEWAAGRGTFMTDAARGQFAAGPNVKIYREAPPEAVADILGNTADVLVRDRNMRADGQIVQLAKSYIPLDIAAGTVLEQTNTGPGGMYARLDEMGHRLTHFTELVTARTPGPEEMSLLDLGSTTPVLQITRIAYAGERVVEVNVMVVNPRTHVLQYDIDPD